MKKAVDAPKGFHWMKAGKGFKLMKNPTGGYVAHKGASKKASFEVQKIHKKGICSDHQSKEKRDCCREAVREAAQKDSS